MNYQCRFMGNVFDFGQKVAAYVAQQSLQLDAAMARTLELEQERDECQRRSDEWEVKSGEWQRKSCEYEKERDEAERQRLQLQADLNQSQEALRISNQTGLDLAAQVEKLKIDVVDSGKKVEKVFNLYQKLKKKFGKADKVLSPPKP